jgi:S1-C subfamily serine protease
MGRFGITIVQCVLAWTAGVSMGVPARGAEDDVGEKIYKLALRSTVWIVVPRDKDANKGTVRIDTGTGSVVNFAKHIVLTNYHVVGDRREDETVFIFFPVIQKGRVVAERKVYMDLLGKKQAHLGKVIARDSKRDLALIQVQTPLPVGVQQVRLAPSSASPGQRVHSLGNPGGTDLWSYTQGFVRQIGHKKWQPKAGDRVYDFEARVLTTQSPTNPGDSGGPLFNDRGELVAVTQGGLLNAQQISFFIDVTEARNFLHDHKLLPHSSGPVVIAEKPDEDAEKPGTEKAAQDKQKAERDAAQKLRFAKGLVKDNKTKALQRLEEIITVYPETEAATEAKVLLDQLKK